LPFPEFDPVLVQLGPFAIRWYALAYIGGILLGWRYAVRLIRTPRLWGAAGPPATGEQVDDFILWATLGIIVGGRLGHVFFYTPDLIWTDPLEVLKVWNGGMSFHGGALGVFLAMIGFAWRNKLDLWRLGDLSSMVVPIGLLLGRVANFINGELWGRPTDGPFGVVFCNQQIVETYGTCPAGYVARHPSQLYEAALEGLVLLVVLWFAAYKGRLLERRGVVMGLFVALYGAFRISLENVRQPDQGLESLPLGLTMGMYLSIPMVLFGLWLIWRGLREPAKPAINEPA
jgi:phosphatidylglycerol:prolipoprotein diacylglycerol transferase